MSSEAIWTSIENAVATYSLETSLILKWVDDGSVCAEQPDTRFMRIRVDDLKQKIQHVKKSNKDFLDSD
jgi:hypothetical protein